MKVHDLVMDDARLKMREIAKVLLQHYNMKQLPEKNDIYSKDVLLIFQRNSQDFNHFGSNVDTTTHL